MGALARSAAGPIRRERFAKSAAATFVSVLQHTPPDGVERSALAVAIAATVALLTGRVREHVHVLFAPPAAGRIALRRGVARVVRPQSRPSKRKSGFWLTRNRCDFLHTSLKQTSTVAAIPTTGFAMTTKNATGLTLRRALNRPFDPTGVYPHGWTDLHYAALLNLPGLVNALLWRGSQVDARLAESAAANDDLVTLLKRFGVDFTLCSGETPLHLASLNNAPLAAHTLLKNGAAIHATLPTVSDWTPLHVAARFNAAATACVLLRHGANIAHRDEFNAPPLHTAALYNAVDTADAPPRRRRPGGRKGG